MYLVHSSYPTGLKYGVHLKYFCRKTRIHKFVTGWPIIPILVYVLAEASTSSLRSDEFTSVKAFRVLFLLPLLVWDKSSYYFSLAL